MRDPKQRIPLESKEEALEQYDYVPDEIILAREPQYARAIGRFLIAFSNLEASLGWLIIEAINDRSHDPGYKVIKYLNFHNKTNLARDQYGQMITFISDTKTKQKDSRELDIIISKLTELGEFRNKIAHANWMSLDAGGYVRVKIDESDGGVVFRRVKMTPGTMLKFTRQCRALASRIEDFREQVEEDLFSPK